MGELTKQQCMAYIWQEIKDLDEETLIKFGQFVCTNEVCNRIVNIMTDAIDAGVPEKHVPVYVYSGITGSPISPDKCSVNHVNERLLVSIKEKDIVRREYIIFIQQIVMKFGVLSIYQEKDDSVLYNGRLLHHTGVAEFRNLFSSSQNIGVSDFIDFQKEVIKRLEEKYGKLDKNKWMLVSHLPKPTFD
jgi:hypothetical protein